MTPRRLVRSSTGTGTFYGVAANSSIGAQVNVLRMSIQQGDIDRSADRATVEQLRIFVAMLLGMLLNVLEHGFIGACHRKSLLNPREKRTTSERASCLLCIQPRRGLSRHRSGSSA